jgi:hypothetical protein
MEEDKNLYQVTSWFKGAPNEMKIIMMELQTECWRAKVDLEFKDLSDGYGAYFSYKIVGPKEIVEAIQRNHEARVDKVIEKLGREEERRQQPMGCTFGLMSLLQKFF